MLSAAMLTSTLVPLRPEHLGWLAVACQASDPPGSAGLAREWIARAMGENWGENVLHTVLVRLMAVAPWTVMLDGIQTATVTPIENPLTVMVQECVPIPRMACTLCGESLCRWKVFPSTFLTMVAAQSRVRS